MRERERVGWAPLEPDPPAYPDDPEVMLDAPRAGTDDVEPPPPPESPDDARPAVVVTVATAPPADVTALVGELGAETGVDGAGGVTVGVFTGTETVGFGSVGDGRLGVGTVGVVTVGTGRDESASAVPPTMPAIAIAHRIAADLTPR